MKIDFTIPFPFVEFIVHFIAMIFYCIAGSCMRDADDMAPMLLFFGITLTIIGAQL